MGELDERRKWHSEQLTSQRHAILHYDDLVMNLEDQCNLWFKDPDPNVRACAKRIQVLLGLHGYDAPERPESIRPLPELERVFQDGEQDSASAE